MIPQRVYMKGFMSYRDETTLSFRGSSLWVLAGRNGAGKSAVFDAMTFALGAGLVRPCRFFRPLFCASRRCQRRISPTPRMEAAAVGAAVSTEEEAGAVSAEEREAGAFTQQRAVAGSTEVVGSTAVAGSTTVAGSTAVASL